MSSTERTLGLSAGLPVERALTNLQSQIWTSQRLSPRAPLANMGTVHRIAGSVDPDRLVRAVDAVVRASDALRTVVVDRPGETARARILPEPPRPTTVLDLPVGDLDEWCVERIATPIDATTCAYDSVLLRHGDERWTWWLDLHHVVTDAWSSALVFATVADAYTALADPAADVDLGAALVPFHRFVAETARQLPTPVVGPRPLVSAVAAAGEPTPITPYGPRGPRTTSVERHQLDASPLTRLPDRYRTLSADLSTLAYLATTCAVTLHRLDGRDHVVLGVPLHHRSGRVARRVIGPVMELWPLVIELTPTDTFATVFDRAHRGVLELMRRATPGHGPDVAFDAVLNVQTARYADFAGLPAITTWARSGHVEPMHAIRLHVHDYGDGRRLDLDLNGALSADGSHRAFPDHLSLTMAEAARDPDAGIGDVELLTAADRATLDALNPAAPARTWQPVHEAIAERLRRQPSLVVAEHAGQQLTAAELDRRAGALAGWLVDHGVERGDRVGIRMSRGLPVLVALHGVLRAGGSFVMLDPADPPARHDRIAADAELVLILDELPADADGAAHVAAERSVGPDDVAYVMFTSGSTGEPKGVPISHRGLADYLAAAIEAYQPGPVVMPLHSALTVDLTITSLFLPQLVGGRTVVVDGDPITALGHIARDRRLTALKATPSQLELLHRMVGEPLSLATVIVGGEAFRRPTAMALRQRCAGDVRIFNEYGPTEAVVGCMVHEWDPAADAGPDVPIGRASPGAEVHVLDAHGRRTPPGAWGELFVRRPGMATGYLHRPEETAARFAEVPSIGGGPLYRTGDRVRVEAGVLIYGGRADDQLSVGGFRLEPGEVEAALVRHDRVTSAVVRVWTPGTATIVRCRRCGIGTDVPGVAIDESLTCSQCRTFDVVEPQTRSWFRTVDDLDAIRARARERATGDIDCLHLLSGGKDSTYALYRLVEQGWRVHALTLDNGYIAEGAKENIRNTVRDLGITHEFATTPAMREIFRDSLERYANVCNGCYKTIYTVATARAFELGIPVIVTGLSRGQFFETRLAPHQFEAGRFDPDEIDRTVLQARRAYHRTRDAVTRLVPEHAVFERDDVDVLAEVEYVDFYRYVDVELAEIYSFLDRRAPWVRPADTGRSTNCLINVAGIHVHQTERGYHNYAEPYSWDVRLGHKTRDEARRELDDVIDVDEVSQLLAEVAYEPRRPEVLTAWYQTVDGRPVDARLLASHLRELLPARAVPTAFVHVDGLPLADSAKLDVSSLPAPDRAHTGAGSYVAPDTPTEAFLAGLWTDLLEVGRVGIDDDFFDIGGTSLAALETVAAAEREFQVQLPDAIVFERRVLRDVAAAVDEQRATGRSLEPISPLPPEAGRPLSPVEEALLLDHLSAPDDPRYHVTRLYELDTDLDPDRLQQALLQVVARHEPLHTAFDAGRTVLAPTAALSVEPLPPGSPDAFAEVQRAVPFDLEHGPLVRVHVGRTGEARWHVLVGMHHATIDAGTFDTFWDEVDAAYHGRPLPALAATYSAHGAWQRSRAAASEHFWAARTELVDADVPASTIGSAPTVAEPDGYLEVAAPVTTGELAAAATTTTFAAALGAAAVALGAFRRDRTVELGITASTKDHVGCDPLVGYFLNTVPVVLRVEPDATLADVDALAAATVAEVLPHRAYPLAQIVRDARRDGRRPPDVSSMVAYERLAPVRFGDAPAAHRIIPSGSSVADLTLFVHEQGDRLRIGVEYRGRSVGRARATKVLAAFADAMATMCHRPHQTVADVHAALAADDLVGPPIVADPSTVVAQILEHARATPERTAVIDAAGATSFGALVERAQVLADHLGAELGRPRRIGVSLGRSRSLLESVLGIHLAGAAYVPIEPAAPPAHHRHVARVAALDAVIVDATTAPLFPELRRVDIGAVARREGPATAAASSRPSPDDAAYVVFTSGSTGEPAGVEVSHAALAASTAARRDVYGPVPPARFLLTPSIGFDSSMVGLFWPLATGGAVVVPDDADVHDVDRLGAVIAAHAVTHVLMVPSLYRALLRRRPDRLTSLQTAIVAGEACPAPLVEEHHRRLPGCELVNEYGPTEATVWATAHRCEPGEDPVPIGRPIPGVRARVADGGLRSMPPTAAGELLVAGPGVIAGYLSGRSDEVFVDDGERRWYRTGDLVRSDDHGRLLFLGRVDDQLNVGGLRLEPTELEAHLGQFDGVQEAVVVSAEVEGRSSLVAHVVADRERVDARALRTHLLERVGPAAVPRRFAFHDELPRTAHGKLDRQRAAQLPIGEPGAAPPAESAVVLGIWRTVLGRPDLRPDDDFFEQGGDSLAAAELVTALGQRFARDVPVAMLLRSPTPAAMAAALGVDTEASSAGNVSLITLRPGRVGGPTVLTTPGWDAVLGYRDLADAFPDDVRVLAVAALEGSRDPELLTVGQLVDRAIAQHGDALREQSPRPLVVLGWSIGGVVAFELAQRLAGHGVTVRAVALVDTVFPGQHRHRWSNRWSKYRSLLSEGSLRVAGRELAVMVRRRALRYVAALGRKLLAVAGEPVVRPTVARTASGVPMSALDHQPVASQVPVILYAASTTNPARSERPWRAVAPGLRVVTIEGRHRGYQSVMGRDRVHRIADDLVATVLESAK